ncbi:universal stress protein [Nocardia seriolae]|uniref:Universal stress protein n=2 Tax=Nocardia seriolae TaxID=37332 RepID=A0ABC9YY93_9NOCA|nr:hypothetical protein NSERKGN1266_53920 [Nocardia seriolae]BEK94943.1 hypothetical protein NSER024013_28490 [Nocardia seriolae]GAP30287.1 universal stress protein [Nocardia seriolae]GEM25810.1 hypothetical protein NS2_40490 [Nocardia seriolae NBRC 15557]
MDTGGRECPATGRDHQGEKDARWGPSVLSAVIARETDDYEPGIHIGWSVVAAGIAGPVTLVGGLWSIERSAVSGGAWATALRESCSAWNRAGRRRSLGHCPVTIARSGGESGLNTVKVWFHMGLSPISTSEVTMTRRDFDEVHRLASAPVVGVDESDGAGLAVGWAARYAARRGRELQLAHGMNLAGAGTLLGTYQVITASAAEEVRAQSHEATARAERIARQIEPGLAITTYLADGTGAQTLIERSVCAYAVVMGATGNHGTMRHLGSTLLTVTSHAAGAVIVVRSEPRAGDTVRESGPVVVGVDGSPTGEAAIAAAFAEAAERDAELVAVHVWSDWDAGKFAGGSSRDSLAEIDDIETAILAERLAGWREKYPEVEVTREVYVASPARQLLELSKHAQLVVVGNRGRGGFTGMLLGSTAHSLVQHAHCSVMVVHGEPEQR